MKDITYLEKNGIDVEDAIEILGDLEMYQETLQDFLDVSETRFLELEQYVQEQDMENYAILVHALKSDSKYLGFTKLADLAFGHQQKSEEKDCSYIVSHYVELKDEYKRIIDVVSNYLA